MNKVLKNYIYNLCYQITAILIPIITTPYISRRLGPAGVGKYDYVFTMASIALMLEQLGTNIYGQREIAYVRNDLHERSIVFWNIVFVRIITTCVILPIFMIISFGMLSYQPLMSVFSLYLLSNVFDVSWFFQGMEDFKKTALRSIIIKLVGMICIFMFVRNQSDLLVYAFVISISQLIGCLVLDVYAHKYVEFVNFSNLNIKKQLKPILGLFLPSVIMYVYTFLDKVFLGVLTDDRQVAFYAEPEKIIKLLMTIITSLGVVLLPHVSAEVSRTNNETIKKELMKYLRLVGGLGIPMTIGVIIISNRLIPLYLGEDFVPAAPVFALLAPLIIIIGMASVWGQTVLIPLKKNKIYTISISVGAVANIIANTILVPRMGAIGASIGTLIAEGLVTIVQINAVKSLLEIKMIDMLKVNINYICGGLLVLLIGKILDIIFPQSLWSLIILVSIGALGYVSYLVARKDWLIVLLREKIKGVV